jgi:hypothetical protein
MPQVRSSLPLSSTIVERRSKRLSIAVVLFVVHAVNGKRGIAHLALRTDARRKAGYLPPWKVA